MISLSALASLATEFKSDLDLSVAPLPLGNEILDTGSFPAIMGAVNLSRDSSYRTSVATSVEHAQRKCRVMVAQGASIIDLGAESSTAKAARVDADSQTAALIPVVGLLAAEGIHVSVETYHASVARACFKAGAHMLNHTGAVHDEEIFDLVAEFNATIVLCYVPGADVREIADAPICSDPIPELLEYFGARIAHARSRGVERIAIDPGIGFFYGNLVKDPVERAEYQSRVLLNTFRLRRLGLPICQSMPHAYDLFEDQYRTGEGFFAVLAHLGGAGLFRVHEVDHVARVLLAMHRLNSR